MTNTITTYNDLLREKQRLTALLQAQKEVVREDIQEIKEELAPIKSAISMVGKFATKDHNNVLLTTVADKVIDLVIRKLILHRAGWITKMAVPFLMKNFSSHVIADNKDKLFGLFASLFTKKKKNGQAPHPVEAEEEEED